MAPPGVEGRRETGGREPRPAPGYPPPQRSAGGEGRAGLAFPPRGPRTPAAPRRSRQLGLTLYGVVHLLDEQLQLHHQGGRVAVRLPRRRLLGAGPEGRVDPLLHVEVFRQELREVHGRTRAQPRRPGLIELAPAATRLWGRAALRGHRGWLGGAAAGRNPSAH